MRRGLFAILALSVLAACSNPAPKAKHAPQEQADAAAPRTCRGWTLDTATLRCTADVMKGDYAAANAKRIASAEDKLSRYNPLAEDLCKDSGAARQTRDRAVAYAQSDAQTRVELDKTQEPSTIIALCHDAVIKIVARGEENGGGRQAIAEAHPFVDDTPKETGGN